MNDIQKKSLLFTALLSFGFFSLTISASWFKPIFIYLILVLSVFSIYFFNIKFAIEDIKIKGKFLIIPFLFNLGSFLFIENIFQVPLKLLLATLIILLDYYMFIAIKRVQNLEDKAAIFQRNLLVSISFLAVFFSLSAIYKYYVLLSGTNWTSFSLLALIVINGWIFYVISNFLAWENGFNIKKFLPYNLTGTLLVMEVSLISAIWIINYPVFSNVEKANLGGVPLPAVYLTIIFYFIWGLISHKMDKSLTRKVMVEYIFITTVFLFVLLLTAKWLPKI